MMRYCGFFTLFVMRIGTVLMAWLQLIKVTGGGPNLVDYLS